MRESENDCMNNCNPQNPKLGIGEVRRCGFFVIIRVIDKYFKTKVDAKSIEDAEQIIEKTIAGFEYQIMNIYKANE